jgi:hypothetical protein
MRTLSFDVRDKANAASVVLISRSIKALGTLVPDVVGW